MPALPKRRGVEDPLKRPPKKNKEFATFYVVLKYFDTFSKI
jgi:hypothetical protein